MRVCVLMKLMGIVCRVQVYSVDDEPTVLRSMTNSVLQGDDSLVEGIAANTSHWFVTTRHQIHKFVMATGEHVFSVGTTDIDIGDCSELAGIVLYGTELFVVDTMCRRVIVFESDGGTFVRKFGSDEQLRDPWRVAVNAAHVFVSDVKRVVVFDRVDGSCVRTMDIGWVGYAFVCNHTFFAVSVYDHVRVFDATSGTLLHTFGSEGSGLLQFRPRGMTIVGDRLWIVDTDNHCIQIVA
jgi:hypothetical protein